MTDKIERLERLRQKREQGEKDKIERLERLRQRLEQEEKLWALRIEAVAPLQAEAREAWKNDRKLIAGAYYKHKRYCGPRRIIELRGNYVHWADEYERGLCLHQSFLKKVEGPL